MIYTCKILNDDFLLKVNEYITKQIENHYAEYTSIQQTMIKLEYRELLNNIWNKKIHSVEVDRILQEEGILVPQYKEVDIPKADKGYQTQPRIEWKGEIRKIDDIDEIFSFKVLN